MTQTTELDGIKKQCGVCAQMHRHPSGLVFCVAHNDLFSPEHGADCELFVARRTCPQCRMPTTAHKLSCSCGHGKGLRLKVKGTE